VRGFGIGAASNFASPKTCRTDWRNISRACTVKLVSQKEREEEEERRQRGGERGGESEREGERERE